MGTAVTPVLTLAACRLGEFTGELQEQASEA